MDIEFNKTLCSFDKLKAGAPEKMLTECRNMGFEKHTVKLLHCSLNSINEDEYTILQRSFENVGLKTLRKNSLVNSQSVKTQMSNYSLIELHLI
jgi:hypothetical protein